MTRTLWVVGAGGHAGVVADAALAAGRWRELAFFDDRWPQLAAVRHGPVLGPVTALRERLAALARAAAPEVIVAVGDNVRRLALSRELAAAGATLATVVHPSAVLSPSADIGPGSLVAAGAVLNPGTRIGLAGIVNTRASVDHDCTVGDGVHLCPGVTLAGNVHVGDLAWVGIGSCVIQGRSIGAGATVGAGAVVIADVEAGATVVGCPAKEKKTG